ncbi:hypothetical protein [Antrihabitans spumae]|uniref:Uncharacterized protein n=1 Tax=Antrihabitans spumae TaxID=3373370 RepID=A0ABW7KGL8_9NOCA
MITKVATLATLLTLAFVTAPERIQHWTKTSRTRGDTIGWVILAAGAAAMAIMIIAYVTPKVQEYLNRIQ